MERVVGASRNADYVYFIAAGDLAPGATSGERNLYVEHEGAIDFVGTDPTGDPGQGYPFYVTPDGLHAAFMSAEGQTGYDNAGKTEVYKYSYGAGLECASCRPSGEPPTGDASIAGRALSRRRQPPLLPEHRRRRARRRRALSPTSSSTPAAKPSC